MAVSTGRRNPFMRDSPDTTRSPPIAGARPQSMAFISPSSASDVRGHNRNQSLQSFSPSGNTSLALPRVVMPRSTSTRSSVQKSNTFAPSFIQTEEPQTDTERVRSIEGENDFSGKRYVWIRDPQTAFVKGWVVEELEGDQFLVQCDDGSVSKINIPLCAIRLTLR